MTAPEYVLTVDFVDRACDPRLEKFADLDLKSTHSQAKFRYHMNGALHAHSKRCIFPFQKTDHFQTPRQIGESILEEMQVPDELKELVHRNTVRQLVVGLLDDPSVPSSCIPEITAFFDSNDISEESWDDFLESTGKNETTDYREGRDEIHLQDLCKTFVAGMACANDATQQSLHVRALQNLFQTQPVIERWKCPPLFTVENGDFNTWVLTSYYPTPQQHRLFLGAPVQLQSATGLRCRVTAKCEGSPQVTVLE